MNSILCSVARAGFAIADLQGRNIWALFVQPGYEGMGVGKSLQKLMLDWYFSQIREAVWLGTAPGSSAESFYRRSGWTERGRRPNGETWFEITYDNWKKIVPHLFQKPIVSIASGTVPMKR
jgi:GNAT superfamily N-acetyltransferase